MQSKCLYSSFDLNQIAQVRQFCFDKNLYPTGALFVGNNTPVDYIQLTTSAGATEIHLQYDACTCAKVHQIQNAGFQSMAWLRVAPGMTADVSIKYWDIDTEDACFSFSIILLLEPHVSPSLQFAFHQNSIQEVRLLITRMCLVQLIHNFCDHCPSSLLPFCPVAKCVIQVFVTTHTEYVTVFQFLPGE
jgi:hypothetical protein